MRRTMNRVLTSVCFLCAAVVLKAQGSMNIHQTNGITVLLDMAGIDSVEYQLEPPPPVMFVHQTDGPVLSYTVTDIDSITYSPGGPDGSAQVTTFPPASVGATGALCSGLVGQPGDSPVVARGICYGTDELPDLSGPSVAAAGSTGPFQVQLTGLQPGASYFARTFATNAQGTSYGNQVSFSARSADYLNPALTYGSVTDQEGNSYATIVIGAQEWMAENLRTATYANGDTIPNVTDAGQWAGSTTGAWCHYEHGAAYDIPFGKLYNWYAAVDARNVCPTGWHAATEQEWITLADYLGGTDVAGGKMKSTGTIGSGNGLWIEPNTDATNESGFSALPGGSCSFDGAFYSNGSSGHWWSPTGGSVTAYRQLVTWFGSIEGSGASQTLGYSVRCVRD